MFGTICTTAVVLKLFLLTAWYYLPQGIVAQSRLKSETVWASQRLAHARF